MFTIQKAPADTDWREVAQLYYDTWQSAYQKLLPQPFLASLSPAIWHPERRAQRTFLATVDGHLAGVCAYGPARYQDYTGFGEVYSLYVHPDFQRQGIGSALLTKALEALSDYPQVYLVVLVNNFAAQALYQRAGFTATDDLRKDVQPLATLAEVVYIK